MKPQGVMVWLGVGYNAKGPLIFVKAGIKINTDVYREEILEPVEVWAEQHYGVDEEGKSRYQVGWTFRFRLLERLDVSTRWGSVTHEHQGQSGEVQDSNAEMA